MLVAARIPLSTGVIEWPFCQTATVVVKRSFDLMTRAVGPASAVQAVLGLDRFDEGGNLLYPSDFAPTKALCDVGVVGRALRVPSGPVRIVVEPMRKLVERCDALGPRPGVGPLGDPTGTGGRDWTSATFDFEAFQWAPRDQRVPPPSLPLEVIVDVGPRRMVTRIEGPVPDALLIDESGWTAPQPIALRIDAMGFDLAENRIEVVWRGVVDIPRGARPVLAVDGAASLRGWSPSDMLRWPRAEALDPALLRRLMSLAASARRVGPGGTGALHDFDEDGLVTGNMYASSFGDAGLVVGATMDTIVIGPQESVLPAAASLGAARADDEMPDLPERTVSIEVPVELRAAPALPFLDAPSPRGTLAAPLPKLARHDMLGEQDALAGTFAILAGTPSARALPFTSAMPVAPPPAAPAPDSLPPMRAPAPTAPEVEDTADSADPLAGTFVVRATPERPALPFAAAAPVRGRMATVPDAPPARSDTMDLDISSMPVATLAGPAARAPSPILLGVAATLGQVAAPSPVSAASGRATGTASIEPVEVVEGLTAARFAAIKGMLWAGDVPRRTALARNGLTELAWRIAEKRFTAQLGKKTPEELRAIVAAMRAWPAPADPDTHPERRGDGSGRLLP